MLENHLNFKVTVDCVYMVLDLHLNCFSKRASIVGIKLILFSLIVVSLSAGGVTVDISLSELSAESQVLVALALGKDNDQANHLWESMILHASSQGKLCYCVSRWLNTL